MSRKVIYTRLQTELHAPSVGTLGTVFPPQSKTLDNLEMTLNESVLVISFSYRGLKKELAIPLANIIAMELAPEEKKASSK